MFRAFILILVSFVAGCAVYHDGERVNGVFGAQGIVANTYAGADANAVEAGISRCDQLLAKYKPGDTIRCMDAAGSVYVGPVEGFHGAGSGIYYNGDTAIGRYTTTDDIGWAAAVSQQYRLAEEAKAKLRQFRQENTNIWHDMKELGLVPPGIFTREYCLELLEADLRQYCLDQLK